MPTAPTQAARTAALARLRAHLADPTSPAPSRADLSVLLNPNAQAVALAAENERLRGELADARAQIAQNADSARAKERECDELRAKLVERQEAMLRPLVDALSRLPSAIFTSSWCQLTPVERAVWVCEHFATANP